MDVSIHRNRGLDREGEMNGENERNKRDYFFNIMLAKKCNQVKVGQVLLGNGERVKKKWGTGC